MRKRLSNETGASMVEYALLVALIAVMALTAVTLLGHSTESTFLAIGDSFESADGSGNVGPGAPGDTENPGDNNSGGNNGAGNNGGGAGGGNNNGGGGNGGPGDNNGGGNNGGPGDNNGGPGDNNGGGGNGGGGNNGGGDGGSSGTPGGTDLDPGSAVNSKAEDAAFYWWNDTKDGGEGAWTASVTYSNDWIRHQYLTIEVTTIDHNGKRHTSVVNDFYVPANGTATYTQWNNNLTLSDGSKTGTVRVEFKVTSVRTSDQDWQPVTYRVDGKVTGVNSPK